MAKTRLAEIPKELQAIKLAIQTRRSKGRDHIRRVWIRAVWITGSSTGQDYWAISLNITAKKGWDLWIRQHEGYLTVNEQHPGRFHTKICLSDPTDFPRRLWKILGRLYGAWFDD